MKLKTKYFFLILLCGLILGAVGCNGNEKSQTGYHVYYLNKEQTKLVETAYEPKNEGGRLVEELLKELQTVPELVEYSMPLPKDVYVRKWKVENHRLYLYFSSDYLNLETAQEVLARAAYVRTLVQVPGIESVAFYTGDTPLLNKNDKSVGFMTEDSFVENPGKKINEIKIVTIVLYFANRDGTKLVKEVQEVPYNTNISMEKFIMERLLNGPLSEDLAAAVPKKTALVSTSVLDGVCFVSLNDKFMDKSNHMPGELVIYSIVNSLAELPDINKVQISVNGETKITYQEKFSLDTIYERNLEYVEGE